MDEFIQTPETSLVGIALTDPRALYDIDDLAPDDFSDEQCGRIWATITRLGQQGKPHDVAAVSASTGVDKRLLADLAELAPVGASAPFYADLVRKEATRRRLIITGRQIVQLATEAEIDGIPEAVEIARAEIDAAGRLGGSLEGISAGEYFDEHVAMLDQPRRMTATPWEDLDFLIGGWRPGAMYVIGARPGVGKSVLGLQSALGLQKTGTVLFSTLEMSRDEVENRIIAQVATVPLRALISDQLEDRHRRAIEACAEVLRAHRVHIDDRGNIGPTEIRSAARSLARRGHLAGIVVDYLQLMTAPRGDRRPRHEVVADYSRRLKLLAKELQVPVIALSQLNRGAANDDRPPRISDLRESGAVEQDADVIMLLHQTEERPDELHVRVGKNRHGSKGTFTLAFEGAYTRATHYQWKPGDVVP